MYFRIINSVLRISTLCCKFLLLLFVAKFLSLQSMALYGLMAGTISFCLYFIGLEFYTYVTRELIACDNIDRANYLMNASLFYIMIYLIIIPLLIPLFMCNYLPWTVVHWFFIILVLEHISQELYRVLVALAEPIFATMILFIRSGLWCIFCLFILFFFPEMRNLNTVFFAWTIGAGLSCFIGITYLFINNKFCMRGVNWVWIIKGIKTSIPLLFASLLMRWIFVFDRFALESIGGTEILAAYVLFISMGSFLLNFIDAAIVSFSYPGLIGAVKNGNVLLFKERLHIVSRNIIISIIVISFLIGLLAQPMLFLLGKEVYIHNYYMLIWILISMALYGLSIIPHLALYAHGQDRAILLGNFTGGVVFTLTIYFGSNKLGEDIVLYAMCFAFLVILTWKFTAYKLYTRAPDEKDKILFTSAA